MFRYLILIICYKNNYLLQKIQFLLQVWNGNKTGSPGTWTLVKQVELSSQVPSIMRPLDIEYDFSSTHPNYSLQT